MLLDPQTLPNVFIVREILQWSTLDDEKNGIGCCWILKHWRMCSSCEKFFNDLISMTRQMTSDIRQSSNIGECDDDGSKTSIISSRWREKGHRMSVNDETMANMMMLRDILQWSHLNEEKEDGVCCSILKHWRMCSSCEKFFNDLISMTRKRTSDIGQSSKIGECDDDGCKTSMISSRWKEKEHRMLVNDQTLANVMMLRGTLQWPHLVEEKKGIGCWSMIKHWRMWWCWEKFFNELISIKRQRTSDVGKWSNICDCDNDERNSCMIWSWCREQEHRMLGSDQRLPNVFVVMEILQWCHLYVEKKHMGCGSIIKHCRICSS